jgi:phosphodiesterase/alkaline phosphatase D-like protein
VALIHRKVGGVTPSGFVVAQKTSANSEVRLRYSTASDLSGATVSAAVTPDANGLSKVTLVGLSPDTTYYYGYRLDGADTVPYGRCKTLKSGAHSFSFAFGSCLQNLASGTVFDAIRAKNPAFLLHFGDMNYFDLVSSLASDYRAKWDKLFADVPKFHEFWANVPVAYIWSDHDYGDNNCPGAIPGRDVARAVYREYTPRYPLVEATGSIYHTFVIGRVRFIMLDTRSNRSAWTDADTATKTMLGATQKQWLKDLLLANPDEPKVLCSDSPWVATTNDNEHWGAYRTEREEIADFVRANGIRNVVCLGGDLHAAAADYGVNSTGRFPQFLASPFEKDAVVRGGPYTHGPSPAATNGAVTLKQYGWVDVTDDGGNAVTLTYTAFDEAGAKLFPSLSVAMPMTTAAQAGPVTGRARS